GRQPWQTSHEPSIRWRSCRMPLARSGTWTAGFCSGTMVAHPSRGCFITGTDTGVGKTAVTAALVLAVQRRGLATGVMKPVETGVGPSAGSSDAERLQRMAGSTAPLELISPYRFPAPLAPLAAARQAG